MVRSQRRTQSEQNDEYHPPHPSPHPKVFKTGKPRKIMKSQEEHKGRKRTARKESFSIYIYRVLKQSHPELKISSKSIGIMNSFVLDLFEKISGEASKLTQLSKKNTLSSREIQTAVRLVIPGELARHAVSEGTKAVQKYTVSK